MKLWIEIIVLFLFYKLSRRITLRKPKTNILYAATAPSWGVKYPVLYRISCTSRLGCLKAEIRWVHRIRRILVKYFASNVCLGVLMSWEVKFFFFFFLFSCSFVKYTEFYRGMPERGVWCDVLQMLWLINVEDEWTRMVVISGLLLCNGCFFLETGFYCWIMWFLFFLFTSFFFFNRSCSFLRKSVLLIT